MACRVLDTLALALSALATTNGCDSSTGCISLLQTWDSQHYKKRPAFATCHNVGPEDPDQECYKTVRWAKDKDVKEHPERYKSPYQLNESSALQDFQYHVYIAYPERRCPEPCVDCTIIVSPLARTNFFSMPALPLGKCVPSGQGGAYKATAQWNNYGFCTTLNWATIYHWPQDLACKVETKLAAQISTDGSSFNCPFTHHEEHSQCTSR
mmetsp:Transcript_112070/g.327808  ORF Transcript_112070/g.327808 Transcript_112070/m.327808 type:complete len:210 (+) Transcript_112070:82-711(+)